MFNLKKIHPRYSEYKPTNIDWIGDIPYNWRKFRASTEIKCLMGAPFDSNLFSNENGKPLIRIRDLNNQSIETYYQGEYDVRYLIKSGDHLVWMDWNFHNVIWRSEEWLLNQRVMKIETWNHLEKNFFYHLLSLPLKKVNDLTYATTVKHLSDKDIRGLYFYIPEIKEQRSIVWYLDEKTALIDEAITKKQRQIELLSEHRAALINNAITKGLDKTAEMKDSGIDWVGMIPSEWEVKPLFSEVFENKTKNVGNINNNLLSLSYGRIITKDIENNFGLLPESFETYQIVDEWMIILRLTDLQNDKKSLRVGYVKERGIITSAYTGLISKSNILPVFLYQLLHSYDLQKVFYTLGGWVRQGMNFSDLKKLPILVPSIKEQEQIINYLDKETKYIDSMISKLKNSIELLSEYKTSIISHAVSGKIKVS